MAAAPEVLIRQLYNVHLTLVITVLRLSEGYDERMHSTFLVSDAALITGCVLNFQIQINKMNCRLVHLILWEV